MSPAARRLLWGLAGLAVIAALAAPRLLPSRGRGGANPPPASGAQILRVEVRTLAPEVLEQRLATTGTLRANERVDLVSQIAGKIERIAFREGSRVAAGDLLVKIDDTELRADRERTLHELELAELRERRQRELREQGVTSQDAYDFAASELAVLRAELRLVEAQLEKTEIRAPFSGVVGLRQVSAGAFLSTQTRIAVLQDIDPVKIDFTVPEQYAAAVELGDEVLFRVRGMDRPFRATVFALEPAVDPETRSLVVRARCPNPAGLLVPGAFADVEILIHRVEDALVIPAIAVIPELGGKKVFMLEDGIARGRQVETGIRTEDRVEITAGLAAGERVIVTGIPRLREGLAVEGTEAETRGP